MVYSLLQASKTRKLDVKALESKDGKDSGRVLDQWLFSLNFYFDNYNSFESKKVAIISSLLVDTTIMWW